MALLLVRSALLRAATAASTLVGIVLPCPAQTVPGITGGFTWSPQNASRALLWNSAWLYRWDAGAPAQKLLDALDNPIAPVQGAVTAPNGPAGGRSLVWTPTKLYRHDQNGTQAPEVTLAGGGSIAGVRGIDLAGPAALIWTDTKVFRYQLDQPPAAPVEVKLPGDLPLPDVHGVFHFTGTTVSYAVLWTATALYRYHYGAAPIALTDGALPIAGVRGGVASSRPVVWTDVKVYRIEVPGQFLPAIVEVVGVPASAANPVRGTVVGAGGVLIWTAGGLWRHDPANSSTAATQIFDGGAIAGIEGIVFEPLNGALALLWTPTALRLFAPATNSVVALTWAGQPVASVRGVAWDAPPALRAMVYAAERLFVFDGAAVDQITTPTGTAIVAARGAVTFPGSGPPLVWTATALYVCPWTAGPATLLAAAATPAQEFQGAVCSPGDRALVLTPGKILAWQQAGVLVEVTADGGAIATFDPAQAGAVQVAIHFVRPSAGGSVGASVATPVAFLGRSPGAARTLFGGATAAHSTVVGASHEHTTSMALGPYPVAGYVTGHSLRLFAAGTPGGGGGPFAGGTLGGVPQSLPPQVRRIASRALFSADRRYVAFDTADDGMTISDVYRFDRQTGGAVLVSASLTGQPSRSSFAPSISGDARFVAFHSRATDLVASDTNGVFDVFVRDLLLGQTTRVSVSSNGMEANGHSTTAKVSADGRFVAFISSATNLVAGDTNGVADVFVHDRLTGQTSRVSVATGGAQADAPSSAPALAADGGSIAFTSAATNLVPGDSNGVADVFVRRLANGQTVRASVATDGTQGVGASDRAALSADGALVAFDTDAALDASDTNGQRDVYVRGLMTGTTTRASLTWNGGQPSLDCVAPSLSGDGRFVAFTSAGPDLVAGDTNGRWDAFLRDRATGDVVRLSVDAAGVETSRETKFVALAPHGDGATTWNPGDMTVVGMPFALVRDFHPRLTVAADTMPPGGSLALTLHAPGSAGKTYAAAAALGYGPGLPLFGAWTLPLTADALFLLSLQAPGIFQGYVGVLDAEGKAQLTVNMPANPGLAGLVFYTSCIVFDPALPSGVAGISNARKTTVVP